MRCYNAVPDSLKSQLLVLPKVPKMTTRSSIEAISVGEVTRSLASLLTPLLASLFFLQALRLYFAEVYLIVWAALFSDPIDVTGLLVGVSMVSALLVPLLLPLLRRWVSAHGIALGSAVGLALARLLLGAGLPFEIEAVASWACVSLYGLFLPAYFAEHHRAQTPRRVRGYLVAGLSLALAYDMAIRALGSSIDVSLAGDWLPVQLLLSLVAIAAAVYGRAPTLSTDQSNDLPLLPGWAGTLILSALGALIFLEYNLFMHASTVSRWLQVDYDMMAILLPSATVIGLLIPRFKGLQSLPAAILQNVIILASVGAFLWSDGWASAFLVLVAQVCVVLDLRLLFQVVASHRFQRNTSTIVGIALSLSLLLHFLLTLMLTLTFAYAYTLDAFRGLEPLLFFMGAVILGIAACAGAYTTTSAVLPPTEVPWMKQSLGALPVILALVGFVLQPIVNPQPTDHRALKVMTYNLHQCFGMDNKLDLQEVASTIRQANPDIVGFQEADGGRVPSLSVDQVLWLSRNLNMYSVYGPSWGNTYGVAVLSKYPILSHQRYLLVSHEQQRACLEATIDVGGRTFTFFSVHLGLNSEERHRQLDELLVYTAQASSPKVLVGDFNSHPDSEEIERVLEQFDHSFAIAGSGDGYTSPPDAPMETIDYIFVSPDIQVVSAEVVASLASDHLPVVAEIGLEAP
jgi:endonuclease/exonuclease/phosphatase family metal-dependent hydrolase